MRLSVLLSLLWFVPAIVCATERDTLTEKPVYYENAANGATRFFYDDRYFLADKYCSFKAIERVGYYDFRQQTFVGEFTDFDNRGRVLLRGNYRNGKQEGDFKAFHSNGQLKWEVSYAQGVPQGLWKYYYPDGKPLLDVEYRDGSAFIQSFWDQRGRKRVTDGNGRYEFAVEADGYNEWGYIRYNRRGKVANGRPNGSWTVEYVFEDGKKEGAGYEFYRHGIFEIGYETYKDESFSDGPRYLLLPAAFFERADLMIGKNCTIDEHSGFTGYFIKHLEEWFEGALDEMPDPTKIEFTVAVKKTGEPGKIDVKTTFDRKAYAQRLQESLTWVPFWFPSYADDDFIDDVLTVTVEAFPDAAERKLRFFDVTIQREKGM